MGLTYAQHLLEWQGMQKSTLFLMAAMMAAPLFGQSLQQQADSMQLRQPRFPNTKLEIPTIPGAEVKLLGCDYEQIIDKDGNIRPVCEPTPVRVSFTVTKDGEEVTSRDYELTIHPANYFNGGNAKPKVIPELLQWQGGKGRYELGDTFSVLCHTDVIDTHSVEKALKNDIRELFGKELRNITHYNKPQQASIVLVKTAGGNEDDEDYTLDIRPEIVTIRSGSVKGLYWGTRSLLQILVQGKGTAPCGSAYDAPRYAVRSFMLDVGRLPIPMQDIKTIVRTLSWYKMNELQLHLNDNYIFHEEYVDAGEDPFKRSYSAFRMESNIKGKDGTPLTAQDLSYGKDEFMDLVCDAANMGVRIVPEFDAPGHALSYTRVRPDLIYQGPMNKPKRRCEMLDAANPEALKFAAEVWDEYILEKPEDVKHAPMHWCPVLHVGADEFYGDKEDYRAFADGILRHIISRGHTPRIWGSLHAKKGKTPVIAKGVQMNLWSGQWAKAWDSIRQGYDIINTDDSKLYIVPFADYYQMQNNHKWLYNHWQVNNIHGQVVPSGHPQLLGAMFAVWQDMCDKKHNGYMMYDIWPAISGSIDVLSQKMWGQSKSPRNFEEHRALVQQIGAAPHTDALRRRLAPNDTLELSPSSLPFLFIEKGSLGPEYHLTMELTLGDAPDGQEQVLLDSPEGQLLAVGKNGCIGFRRADTMEFSFIGAKLPVGERVTLELIGKPGSTQLLLNGQPAGTLTLLTHHGRTEELVSTFILPLARIGQSFRGSVHSLKLKPSAE